MSNWRAMLLIATTLAALAIHAQSIVVSYEDVVVLPANIAVPDNYTIVSPSQFQVFTSNSQSILAAIQLYVKASVSFDLTLEVHSAARTPTRGGSTFLGNMTASYLARIPFLQASPPDLITCNLDQSSSSTPINVLAGRAYAFFVSVSVTVPVGATVKFVSVMNAYQAGHYSADSSNQTSLAFMTRLLFDVPPIFSQSAYSNLFLLQTDSAPLRIPFFNLTSAVAAVDPYTLTYEFITQRGTDQITFDYDTSAGLMYLVLTAPDSLLALAPSFGVTVTAHSIKPQCHTMTTIMGGGCTASSLLTVSIVQAFHQDYCPDDIFSSPEVSNVWWGTPDTIGGLPIALISPFSSGDVFPMGVTPVKYSFATADLSQVTESAIACSFNVIKGPARMISEIPHLFYDGGPDSSLLIVDFLVDTSNLHNEKSVSPDFSYHGDVLSNGLALNLISPTSEFHIAPHTSRVSRFEFNLQWCVPGVIFNSSAPASPAEARITKFGLASVFTAGNLPLLDVVGSIANDGSCVAVRGVSMSFSESIDLSRFYLSIIPTAPQEYDGSRAALYLPAPFSFISFVSLPQNDSSPRPYLDPGPSIDVRDRLAPVFTNCPTNPRRFTAPSGATEMVVSWSPPTANDNSGSATVTTDYSPARPLSIRDSPHTIIYYATDPSGYKSNCTFLVYIDYDPVSVNISMMLEPLVLKTEISGNTTGTFAVSTYLLDGRTDASNYTFTATISHATTQLSILLISQTERFVFQPAENFKAFPPSDVTPVVSAAVSAPPNRFEVDLTWMVTGNSISYIQTADIFATLTLIEATRGNFAVNTSFQTTDKWFHTDDSATGMSDVVYLRMKGFTDSFADRFSFAGVRVTLNFPAYAPTANVGSRTYTLTKSSFIRATVTTNDESMLLSSVSSTKLLKIFDDVPPVINNCPSDIIHYASDLGPSVASMGLNWNDPVPSDNRFVASFTVNTNVREFPVGSQTDIVYTATDGSGNTATCAFSVDVVDDLPPFIECPDDIEYSLSPSEAQVTFALYRVEPDWSTYFDNSGENPRNLSSMSLTYAFGHHVVERAIFDPSGNSYTCTFNINVLDTIAPYFTDCDSRTIVAFSQGSMLTTISWNVPVAHDNSNIVYVRAPVEQSGDEFSIGTYALDYVATDQAGNSATCTIHISIQSTTTSDSTSTEASQTVVIGVSVSVSLSVAIACIVFLVYFRFKKVRRPVCNPQSFDAILALLADIQIEGGKRTPREIRREYIKILDVLGKGNFGEVSKGLLSEPGAHASYLVAVKSLHITIDADRGAILQEAAIMAQFNHPFVVGLIGVVTVGEPLLVVIEYCEHGSLNKYLEKHDLPPADKHMIAADCAEGLGYLASLNFIHRDVAARNVLVSSERRAKISDFGMSRETTDSAYYQSKGGQLPVRWTAPEALEERKFSTQSDVWSYGILLYEIWTKAETPYKGMNNQKVWVAVIDGYRLPCPEGCPQEVHDLMLSCWQERSKRPEFDSLSVKLRVLECDHLVRTPTVVHKRPTAVPNQGSRDHLENHAYLDFVKGDHANFIPDMPASSQHSPQLNVSQLTNSPAVPRRSMASRARPVQIGSPATNSDYMEVVRIAASHRDLAQPPEDSSSNSHYSQPQDSTDAQSIKSSLYSKPQDTVSAVDNSVQAQDSAIGHIEPTHNLGVRPSSHSRFDSNASAISTDSNMVRPSDPYMEILPIRPIVNPQASPRNRRASDMKHVHDF